jgi:hypothetical protein
LVGKPQRCCHEQKQNKFSHFFDCLKSLSKVGDWPLFGARNIAKTEKTGPQMAHLHEQGVQGVSFVPKNQGWNATFARPAQPKLPNHFVGKPLDDRNSAKYP